MNIRIKTMLFFSLLFSSAAAEVSIVDLQDKTGTHFYFPMIDKPVIKCSDGELSVISEKNSYTTNLSDVLCYKFIASTDNEVLPIQEQGTFEFIDGHIYVSGQLDNVEIYVYTISGMLVDSMISKGSLIDIDITGYPQGQYVIKTPTITCKFNNK